MKKILVLSCFFFILISCKSNLDKENELVKLQTDSIFSEATTRITNSFSWVNLDSINLKFSSIKDPKLKLIFVKELNAYTIIKKREVDSIVNLGRERDVKASVIAEAEDLKKWNESKAGKIHKKHPEWSKKICISLAKREIWIGMTLNMLKYQRGLPNNSNLSNYGKGNKWQWCWSDYTPSCFYGGEDGVVTSYN